jgi:hypothetical protein
MRVARLALPAALVAVAASAGPAVFLGFRGGEKEALSTQEEARLGDFERNVRASTSLDDRLSGPTYGQLLASSDAAIGLARAKPDAVYTGAAGLGGRTVRQLLAEAAFRLAPYAPDLTTKLVQAVEAPP